MKRILLLQHPFPQMVGIHQIIWMNRCSPARTQALLFRQTGEGTPGCIGKGDLSPGICLPDHNWSLIGQGAKAFLAGLQLACDFLAFSHFNTQGNLCSHKMSKLAYNSDFPRGPYTWLVIDDTKASQCLVFY